MTLGGTNTLFHKTEMVYTKSLKSKELFTVTIRKMYLKNSDSSILEVKFDHEKLNGGDGVVLDSGISDIYFTYFLKEIFCQKWRELTGFSFTDSISSKSDFKKLPTIVIQFSGIGNINVTNNAKLSRLIDSHNRYDVIFEIPPQHYMKYSPVTSSHRNRLNFNLNSGVILGSAAMRGHDILFDGENNRIGFAESSCVYEKQLFHLDKDNGCNFSEPLLVSHCWESINLNECRPESLPSKIVKGSSTYTLYMALNNTSCEKYVQHLFNEILFLHCFHHLVQPYCNIVTSCQTTCQEIITKHQFTKEPISGLLIDDLLLDQTLLPFNKIFFYFIVTILMIAITTIFFKSYLNKFVMSYINKSSSEEEYSPVSTTEQHNQEQEMISLIK